MGTRFEILLYGEDEVRLRAAADEALDEVERLEQKLSLFRGDSTLFRVNALAAQEPVKVEADLFRLLQACQQLWQETDGFFDITIGPLMKCWGFRGDRVTEPSPENLAAARERIGMQHVVLNETDRTVFFDRPEMALDLGGIGKGWAIDEAAEILREAEITSALIHGGTSTICAIGSPPESAGWKIALQPPPPELLPQGQPWPHDYLREVLLHDNSLSVSGLAGRMEETGGVLEGHVLNPHLGRPVRDVPIAAVVAPDAARSDAWSTALLAGGAQLAERLQRNRPGVSSLLLQKNPSPVETLTLHELGW